MGEEYDFALQVNSVQSRAQEIGGGQGRQGGLSVPELQVLTVQ